MNTTAETFGRRLREARKAHGFTQGQLAQQLHTTQQTVSNWEADSYRPDYDSLVMLSDILNMDVPMAAVMAQKPAEENGEATNGDAVPNHPLSKKPRKLIIAMLCMLILLIGAVLVSSHFYTQARIKEGAEKLAWFQLPQEEAIPGQAHIVFFSDPSPAQLAQSFSGVLPKWNIRLNMEEEAGVAFTVKSIESVLFYQNGMAETLPVDITDYFDKPVNHFRIEAGKMRTTTVTVAQDKALLAIGYILYGTDDNGNELSFKNHVALQQ
jgi:Predicted transcriptional regulators